MTAAESDLFSDRRLARNPIAIVGMSGLFPKAPNHQQYWQNIVDGTDCTEDVPASRWSLDDYYDADRDAPDKTYSRRGAFLPEVDFDPLEFGLPPNQLQVTSTMQTLSLGVARDLLIDAGATDSSWYDASRTGVVIGTTGPVPLMHPLAARLSTPVLKEAARSCGLSDADADAIASKFVTAFAPWEENSFPGLLANVVAGRIANRFGLGGMNCTVDAACAASLAAMRTAIAELQDGRADTMITGGVDTENSIFIYMCFSKVGALSPTGQISPFSAEADGTILGEGISMLALRRLSDAERDGNRIYAVIKGLGSSSDGRSKSIYAPRAEGQRIALDRAYEDAECSPASVELFEAHATGTAVGDRTELEALGGLLVDATSESRFAALGSVKSQIGHTKGAAGTASIMKLALALHHKMLPGTINVDAPNSEITPTSPYYVNTRTRPWIRDPTRPVRRAAASAMGFGGTNFHVVLEEHKSEQTIIRTLHDAPRVHIWHAADISSLMELVRSGASVGGGPVPPGHVRIGCVSVDADHEEHLREVAVEQLEKDPGASHWNHPEGVYFRTAALENLKVGALFAGQGSQYLNMGLDAALNNPSVIEAFDQANDSFADADIRLGRIVFPPPVFDDHSRSEQEDALRSTEHAQPAIGALSVGQYRFFQQLGFNADGYLGHSFGEVTALWASGALSTNDFFALARARGLSMSSVSSEDSGTMLAIQATREQVSELIGDLGDIRICNHNAPDQVVVGGGHAGIGEVADRCTSRGFAARELPVSAAFHTPYIAHAVDEFGPAVDAVRIGVPDNTVYANSPGAEYGSDEARNKSTLLDQLLQPVEFVSALEAMRAAGCTVFVEFGPKKVLTSLVNRTLGDQVVAIATDSGPVGNSDLTLKRAATQLIVLGVELSDVNHVRAVDPPARVGSGMTVSLSAPEYTPDERRRAYAQALADGYRVSTMANPPQPPSPVTDQPATRPVPLAPQPTENAVPQSIPTPDDPFESALNAHLGTHQHYLEGQLDIARDLAAAVRGNQLDDGLIRAIEAVADHGVAISRSHTRATEVLGQLIELEMGTTGSARRIEATQYLQETGPIEPSAPPAQIAPLETNPEPPRVPIATVCAVSESAAGVTAAQLRTALQEVVADKTGYPVEMVDPSMDLEADLGVDSIKRVQVLGAVQERYPYLPSLGPEQLGSLRTLDQIVALLTDTAVVEPQAATPDAELIRAALQQVIADKTGYPVEMVDPSMDLEADLGVDSIKRVQVLGAVQERFPHLPNLGPEQLGSLRTLDQIVAFLSTEADVYPKADAAFTTRHNIELVALPSVDRVDDLYGTEPMAAVFDLGGVGADADALGDALIGRGWSVQRTSLRGDLAEIETAITAAASCKANLTVLYIDSSTHWEASQKNLTAAILVAKHMSGEQAVQPTDAVRHAFVTVTRIDGALGFGDAEPTVALAAGVGGLIKSLAAEQPHLYCRALDIHPGMERRDVVAAILSEIDDAAVDTAEVGISELGDRRTIVPSGHASASIQTTIGLAQELDSILLTADDLLVVTGGARGVTALCVRELSRNSAVRFLLLGRSEVQPEPSWANGVDDAELLPSAIGFLSTSGATPREISRVCAEIRSSREISRTLSDLDGRGTYLAVDITDADAVRQVLEPIAAQVTGVVHGAGVLADSLVGAKTAEGITRVFDPKIAGLGTVLGALQAATLQHLILFTSVAGLLGNSGQSDYATANEALTRFAAAWKNMHPDRHVTALSWGAWDGGMVTPVLRDHFLSRGVTLLDPRVGARAFVEQFTAARSGDVAVLIGEDSSLADLQGQTHNEFTARRCLVGLDGEPVVTAHRIGEHAVLPATFAVGAMINVIERGFPGRCVIAVRDFHVHKGIVFDHPIDAVDIRIVPAGDDAFRGHLTSGDQTHPVSHYIATFDLADYPREAPRVEPIHSVGAVSAAELYRDAVQFHGPALQGMRRIVRNTDSSMVFECQLPGTPVALGAFGGVMHNPVLADIILQGPPVLAHRLLGSVCLPLGVGTIEYYSPLPLGEPFFVIVDNPRIGSVDATLDATAVTQDGLVLQKFTDVAVVTTPDLSELFRESVRQWSTS